MMISCTTTPCQPWPMNAPIMIGRPNGASTVLHGIKPMLVANSAIAVAMPELKINGIANVGLSTNGRPKTTGSEIPHSAGTVSYTHLDVYKRQVHNRSARPIIGGRLNSDSSVDKHTNVAPYRQSFPAFCESIASSTPVSYTHLSPASLNANAIS